jgi:hypothetical protein
MGERDSLPRKHTSEEKAAIALAFLNGEHRVSAGAREDLRSPNFDFWSYEVRQRSAQGLGGAPCTGIDAPPAPTPISIGFASAAIPRTHFHSFFLINSIHLSFAVQGNPAVLLELMKAMYEDLGLTTTFSIPPTNLEHFLQAIFLGYNDNPYHNFNHCFCVTQMVCAGPVVFCVFPTK